MSERASGRSQEQALIGRLQQAPVFHRLAGRYLQIFRKIARPQTFTQGQPIIPAGTEGPGLFILIKGQWVIGAQSPREETIEPISTVGELAELSETPQQSEIRSVQDSIALHVPHGFLAALCQRDAELHQRLSRNAIAHLAQRLISANAEVARLGEQCQQVEAELDAAERELNDVRMLQSMRG